MASRILLADDSITIQKVVNLTFADEGIEVVAVSNGETAEKRLSEINPDLVLADIFMPGKNGYELCEYIKQSPQFCEVPVVLLVGAFEPFDQAEARRVKADTHLTKPFESRVLVETVRRLINKGGKPTTGSLGSMTPASAAPPVEETGSGEHSLDTRSMASPLLNIDLNAMSGPSSQAETDHLDPASVTSASGFQTLSDSSPLDLDYSSFIEEPVQFGEDTFRQTQQLASLSSQEQAEILAAQQFESSVLVEEHPPVGQAELSDDIAFVSQASEEWPESNIGTPSTFGYSPQAVLLDFDQVQSPATLGPENEVSLDINIAGETPQQSVATLDRGVDDELDTGKLERPAREATADVEEEDSDESEADYPVTIGPATSLLLSADNPFDVLFDDRSQQTAVQAAPPEAAQGPLDDEATPAAADESQEWASMAPLSPVSGFSTLEMASETASTPSVADEDLAYPAGAEIENVESVETSQDFEQPASSYPSSEIDDEKFSSAAMWSEAETHFTPIDIEAVQVAEPAATGSVGQETGFDFQPVDEGQPAQEAAAAETHQSAVSQESATTPASPVAELSPEMIDEIVRRVVAQMSDQVVREIAWEVVPDCVERVVKELARDSLSKKM